jgi:fructuronate reductase
VRIVHLGLGAFHRSHQAWYTHHAGDAAHWGIASFTGRRPDAARKLAAQDGLFTLVERRSEGDRFELIGSITEAADGADTGRLEQLLAADSTAIITLTITEAAYDQDGQNTPMFRLVRGLEARRTAGVGPIAVVSCDNLARNGDVAAAAVYRIADAEERKGNVGPGFVEWVHEHVSFVSTSVDRITPRTTADDHEAVETHCGYRDEAPVVAESFTDWTLSGDFPAGRPAWEDAGAKFVEDIEPYENRKLWLLNGAHSLLAYTGLLRGHATVAQALADPFCRGLVDAFWNEAQRHLSAPDLDVSSYRSALLARFANPRIAHNLEQIAADGSTKLRMRAVPILLAERESGRSGLGAARMLAAWIDFVSSTSAFKDPLRDAILDAQALEGRERTARLLALVDPALARDADIVFRVDSLMGSFATE